MQNAWNPFLRCSWTALKRRACRLPVRCVMMCWLLPAALLPAALCPADEPGSESRSYQEPPLTDDQLQHWSLRPLQSVVPPVVRDERLIRTDIDRFIQARLESAGLTLQPPAPARTLLRRAALTLTGLLPAAESPQPQLSSVEFNSQVRKLLSESAYGERWAQHWLDLARFAETDGYEHDRVRENAWKYRDWVIDALNRDLPYDQFIRLQIAGDLISSDARDVVATHLRLLVRICRTSICSQNVGTRC